MDRLEKGKQKVLYLEGLGGLEGEEPIFLNAKWSKVALGFLIF